MTQTAHILGVHRQTIYYWIKKGLVKPKQTDEWKKRGVSEEREYAILTAEISKATFGMTPSEYKEFKGLDKENLRDHMDDLELIFTMLGERVSTEITRKEDAQGCPQVEGVVKRGGQWLVMPGKRRNAS